MLWIVGFAAAWLCAAVLLVALGAAASRGDRMTTLVLGRAASTSPWRRPPDAD